MPNSTDIAIIGGGIMGAAIAHFLSFQAAFAGKITVIERDRNYENCATTRSWGGIRQQFTLEENINISLFMAEFLKSAPARLAVTEIQPDLGFHPSGYLFLATQQGRTALERAVETQNRLGAQTKLLSQVELAASFPWLETADLAAGAYGGETEGWLDPHALLMAYRARARADGVEFVHDEVVAVRKTGNCLNGIELKEGGKLTADIIVNAAGPWSGEVATMIGCPLPVEPRKRMTFVFDCRAALPSLPLTIDPSGLAFRPETGQFLAIQSPPENNDPRGEDLELELLPFERELWPLLAARVPAFEAIKMSRAWAGFYDYNYLDQNGIIGRHPELENLYFCTGFSGHGIQQSAAAGRAMMELITGGAYQSLDLSRLGYERILSGHPLREINII
jgi:sarcosine oxidase